MGGSLPSTPGSTHTTSVRVIPPGGAPPRAGRAEVPQTFDFVTRRFALASARDVQQRRAQCEIKLRCRSTSCTKLNPRRFWRCQLPARDGPARKPVVHGPAAACGSTATRS
ncbi:MAG: hypothetical protein WKG07_41980 [Hymenobacter sp.]